jgi:uroporphyrinogen decarboxylase
MKTTMTSRDRVIAALTHQKPDRPPLNYYGTPETDMMLLDHLHLKSREDLLCHLGADLRYVSPKYVGPDRFVGQTGYFTPGLDIWGVRWKPINAGVCTYSEIAHHPLADAETLDDIKAHPWPNVDWCDVSHVKEQIKRLNDPHPRAIVFTMGGNGTFETPWSIRGLERFMMDLIECPEIADFMMMKVTTFLAEVTERALEAADGMIDIVWSSSDVGMQTGMMISPDVWRQLVKPWQQQLIEPYKQMGLFTRYHSDGSIVPIIEDLIDPIQPKAADMNAVNLARRFGGRLAFYGGLDTQELLPMGTPDQVERQMLELINVLGRNGGYIAAASNAIQADVPVENILSLFRTAREYDHRRKS